MTRAEWKIARRHALHDSSYRCQRCADSGTVLSITLSPAWRRIGGAGTFGGAIKNARAYLYLMPADRPALLPIAWSESISNQER